MTLHVSVGDALVRLPIGPIGRSAHTSCTFLDPRETP